MRKILALFAFLLALPAGAQTNFAYPTIPYSSIQSIDFILLESPRFTTQVYTTMPIMAQWFRANMGLPNFSCAGSTWAKSSTGGVSTCTQPTFNDLASVSTQLFGTANTWTAPSTWAYTDTQTPGAGNFYTPYFFAHTVNGAANGSRNSLVVHLTSSVLGATDFVVPIEGIARISAGSGNAFGLNGYAWVDATASSTASASGGEFNVDARRNIENKTGIQIVDVSTSIGAGATRDAAVWIGAQTSAAGFSNGIDFSVGGGTFPVKAAGYLFKTGAGTVAKGLDWTATTFTGNIIDVPRMSLDPNGQLSVTRSSGGRSLVLTGFTGSDQGGEIQQTNATGGSKFSRVAGSGSWQLLNSAYSGVLVDVDDSGNGVFTGSIKGTALILAPPVTKTANYTVDSGASKDSSIIFNGAGSLTITLPAAASFSGRIIRLKTITAQTVVSASSNVVPLAGGAAGTAILAATAGKWADLQSDGTNWITMASN